MSPRGNSNMLPVYKRRRTENIQAGSVMGEGKPTAYLPSSSSSSSYISRFCSSALRTKTLASSSPSDSSIRTLSGDALVRRLGLFDLILIGVGASIGAGIFVVTGTVARDAGPGELVCSELWFCGFESLFPSWIGWKILDVLMKILVVIISTRSFYCYYYYYVVVQWI